MTSRWPAGGSCGSWQIAQGSRWRANSAAGKAALAIPEIEPDLPFLDVQMPEMGGFEVLESLSRSRLPVVIFVTAYDDYVRVPEVHALDYIMKPSTTTASTRPSCTPGRSCAWSRAIPCDIS